MNGMLCKNLCSLISSHLMIPDKSLLLLQHYMLYNSATRTALLKVDFGSRSQSRVPDFYSTFVKKSTLKSTLLDFKSGKSDLDSTPPRRSTPSPKLYSDTRIFKTIDRVDFQENTLFVM